MHFDPVLFWNTIFDKGVLAAVLLLIGYFVNRRLERYRSGRALATEAAKIRLARIGELWEAFDLWDQEARRTFIDFCRNVVAELHAINYPGLQPTKPGEYERALPVLLQLTEQQGEIKIPKEVEALIVKDIPARSAALAKKAQALHRKIDRNRFWLTDDIYKAMQKHCFDMQRAAISVEFTHEGLARMRAAYAALEKSRADVDSTLKALLNSGE